MTTLSEYTALAVAAAKKGGKTSADVAAMGYAEIAGLCGVEGDTPAGFIYRNVRQRVASQLSIDETEAQQEQMCVAIDTALASLPGYVNKKTVIEGGEVKIVDESYTVTG